VARALTGGQSAVNRGLHSAEVAVSLFTTGVPAGFESATGKAFTCKAVAIPVTSSLVKETIVIGRVYV